MASSRASLHPPQSAEETALVQRVVTLMGELATAVEDLPRYPAVEPKDAVLSHGKQLEPGIWEVPTAALQAGEVSLKPPVNSDEPL